MKTKPTKRKNLKRLTVKVAAPPPKPPLGIRPTSVWIMNRVSELSAAISERVRCGQFDGVLLQWMDQQQRLTALLVEKRAKLTTTTPMAQVLVDHVRRNLMQKGVQVPDDAYELGYLG